MATSLAGRLPFYPPRAPKYVSSYPPVLCSAQIDSHPLQIMTDPVRQQSRGFGFVRFYDQRDAHRALIEMQGVYIQPLDCSTSARPLRVSPATPKKHHHIPFAPLPNPHPPPRQDTHTTHASPPVIWDEWASPSLASPPLVSPQASLSAILDRGVHERPAPERLVSHADTASALDPNNATVFVGGLGANVPEETLRALFFPFGEIVYVKIPRGKGCGFVAFAHKQDAQCAIDRMTGFPIQGSRIRLSWGRSQSDKAAMGAAAVALAQMNAQAQTNLLRQRMTATQTQAQAQAQQSGGGGETLLPDLPGLATPLSLHQIRQHEQIQAAASAPPASAPGRHEAFESWPVQSTQSAQPVQTLCDANGWYARVASPSPHRPSNFQNLSNGLPSRRPACGGSSQQQVQQVQQQQQQQQEHALRAAFLDPVLRDRILRDPSLLGRLLGLDQGQGPGSAHQQLMECISSSPPGTWSDASDTNRLAQPLLGALPEYLRDAYWDENRTGACREHECERERLLGPAQESGAAPPTTQVDHGAYADARARISALGPRPHSHSYGTSTASASASASASTSTLASGASLAPSLSQMSMSRHSSLSYSLSAQSFSPTRDFDLAARPSNANLNSKGDHYDYDHGYESSYDYDATGEFQDQQQQQQRWARERAASVAPATASAAQAQAQAFTHTSFQDYRRPAEDMRLGPVPVPTASPRAGASAGAPTLRAMQMNHYALQQQQQPQQQQQQALPGPGDIATSSTTNNTESGPIALSHRPSHSLASPSSDATRGRSAFLWGGYGSEPFVPHQGECERTCADTDRNAMSPCLDDNPEALSDLLALLGVGGHAHSASPAKAPAGAAPTWSSSTAGSPGAPTSWAGPTPTPSTVASASASASVWSSGTSPAVSHVSSRGRAGTSGTCLPGSGTGSGTGSGSDSHAHLRSRDRSAAAALSYGGTHVPVLSPSHA